MTPRLTLLGDGGKDRILLHPLRWLLDRLGFSQAEPAWADLWQVSPKPRGLAERMLAAVRLYPCDVLLVHRDAEAQDPSLRYGEIAGARTRLGEDLPTVCVVPVKMTEAWFLFDERAIRTAAGKPGGRIPLDLPRVTAVERLADPKAKLHELLRLASERRGRRLKDFDAEDAVGRVAELIEDYSPLFRVPAFRAFEGDLALELQRAPPVRP